MYTLLRSAELRRELFPEVPALAFAVVLAEAFYKFHSFALECVAFLATWLVTSYAFWHLRAFWSRRRAATEATMVPVRVGSRTEGGYNAGPF